MKKNYDLKIPLIVIMIFILIFLVFGITYALYRNILVGTTNNIIKTGVIKFSYDEDLSSTNGISLINALPVIDDVGKVMNGSNQYFDFSISCTTTLSDIDYEIILEKLDDSTLPDKYIKVYLTKLYSGNEIVVDSVISDNVIKTYDMYNDAKEDNSKIIYMGSVSKGQTDYVENYRLRMWIMEGDYNPEIVYDKKFSAIVNVKASE